MLCQFHAVCKGTPRRKRRDSARGERDQTSQRRREENQHERVPTAVFQTMSRDVGGAWKTVPRRSGNGKPQRESKSIARGDAECKVRFSVCTDMSCPMRDALTVGLATPRECSLSGSTLQASNAAMRRSCRTIAACHVRPLAMGCSFAQLRSAVRTSHSRHSASLSSVRTSALSEYKLDGLPLQRL
jgi:hypothetical protein